MQRDVDQLQRRTFDVLVVGGGIYGLMIAYDAAQRGLATALIERGDFGSGASFNHLRTIHGGLRYLQTLDLRRSRESMRERRALAQIAPHALKAVPFVLPLYPSPTRGKIAMRAGFLLDRIVSIGKNRDVPAALRLPAGRVVSRGGAVQHYPGLRRQRLTGAAVWSDYIAVEADRLTFSIAEAAHAHGTAIANYVEADAPVVSDRRVTGVTAIDRLSGSRFTIAAALTINATGGAIDRLLTPLGLSAGVPMLKAMNLVTRRDAGQEALGGRSSAQRNLFAVPWQGRALFGTWESSAAAGPDEPIAPGEIDSFIAELNGVFPSLDLTRADITLVHRGIVPARHAGGRLVLEGHEQIRDHAADGVQGLITVAGTKYTTARAVAQRIIDRAMAALGRPSVACRTGTTPLPGGSVRNVTAAIAVARREHDAGLPSDTIPHLIAAYGSRYEDVLQLAAERAEWRQPISSESPVIGAELVRAVRSEMAMHLADAVVRRTPLGVLGYPGDAAAERAAAIVGRERGWDAARMRAEIDALRTSYGIVNALKT